MDPGRFLLLAALAGCLAVPGQARACSCAEEGVAEAIAGAGAIFEGRVVALAGDGGELAVTFAITQAWQGIDRESVTVRTEARESACGYPFEAGGSYLVYTEPGDGLRVSRCSRTRAAAGADEDRRGLGSGTIPVQIEDEAVPAAPARRVPPGRAGCAGCASVGRSTPPPWLLIAFGLALLARRIRA